MASPRELLFTIEKTVALHDQQLKRIVSDVESEKRTRANVNSNIIARLDVQDERQRKSDRYIYIGLGGVAVLECVLMAFIAVKF